MLLESVYRNTCLAQTRTHMFLARLGQSSSIKGGQPIMYMMRNGREMATKKLAITALSTAAGIS